MKVFQYCDHGGLAILRDLELRLSSPDAFNDPFEFSPVMNPADYTKEDGIQTLRQEHMFEEWCRQENRPRDSKTRKYYFEHLSEIVDKLMPDLAARVAREQASFLPRASKVWAVRCFSETCESILMWSHYASQHQGMVIGFDTDREPFNDSERVAILVSCGIIVGRD